MVKEAEGQSVNIMNSPEYYKAQMPLHVIEVDWMLCISTPPVLSATQELVRTTPWASNLSLKIRSNVASSKDD